MNGLNNLKIIEGENRIIVFVGSDIIYHSILPWHPFDNSNNERYISLNEIYLSLLDKGITEKIYVWVEALNKGAIYLCNSYSEGEWVAHGNTRGYGVN